MKNKIFRTVFFALIVLEPLLSYGGAISTISKTALRKTIVIGAKRSGKALTPTLRTAARKSLERAVMRYGDDALRAVQKGGLEVLEQSAKHGDDFLRICAKSSPRAARVLALHADDFMPLIRRVGPEFLEIEVKTPGLGKRVLSLFGDDAVKGFARVPSSDATRLIGYAQRAESPAAAKKLWEGYQATGGKILDHLNWKHIMAGGLSAAAVTAAWKTSDGFQQGLKNVADKHPSVFRDIVSELTLPVRIFLAVLFVCILIPCIRLSLKVTHWLRSRKTVGNASHTQTTTAN